MLAEAPRLASLERLVLYGNRIGDAGAIALAGSATLANLLELDLSHSVNEIGDAGALSLARSPYLTRITLLDLSGDPLSQPVRDALWERFGPAVRLR